MKNPAFPPGYRCPSTGSYQAIGKRGGPTGVVRFCLAGDPLPPTPLPGQKWRPVE